MVIAVSAALLTLSAPVFAQATSAQAAGAQAPTDMAVVAVTGIRASEQKSLETKEKRRQRGSRLRRRHRQDARQESPMCSACLA